MEKWMLGISLSAVMMLSLKANAQKIAPDANLHKTVTHRSEGDGINRNSSNGAANFEPPATAQEIFMPQHIFTDMERVKTVEDMVNVLRKSQVDGVSTGLPDGFHYNIKQWTQQDVTQFAKCPNTFDFFESLLGVGNTAVEKDSDGKFTQDALKAQAALEYLKPECCHSWKGFCNMIANASDETEALRKQYHKDIDEKKKAEKPHGSVVELHKDVEYCGDLPKGETPQAQALAIAANLKTAVRAA